MTMLHSLPIVNCCCCCCSLNQEQRRRDMTRISHENKQMLQRLQKVEPMYKVADWIEDWQRKEELTTMITAYPEGQRPGTSSGAIPLANKVNQRNSIGLIISCLHVM